MEWTRSETLALASARCAHCHGLGLRTLDLEGPSQPCGCVLRNIFRACYARFRECTLNAKFITRMTLERVKGPDKTGSWSRKDEEFVADFCLVSRRALTEAEYHIFKYHYLLGADWNLCTRKLKMDRGVFFHQVYKIEQKLGRIYRELEPYALYPLNEYFASGNKDVKPFRLGAAKIVPIRPPVVRPEFENPGTKTA